METALRVPIRLSLVPVRLSDLVGSLWFRVCFRRDIHL